MKLRGNRFNKTLDRYVGIPGLWLLAQWNRLLYGRGGNPKGRSVLCVQIGTIGDAVLTIPGLNYLQEQGYRCLILASPANEAVYRVEGFPVRVFDLLTVIKSPLLFVRLIRELRKEDFDYVIDFTPWLRLSAFVAGLLKTKSRALLGFQSQGQYRSCIFDRRIRHSDQVHESANYLRLVQQIAGREATVAEHAHALSVAKIHDLVKPETLRQKLGFPFAETDYVIIHPWSAGYRGKDKEWPLENYLSLLEVLPKNFYLVLTGTEADRERTEVFAGQERIVNLTGVTSLLETMELILHARFVVTVNTGILHIAAWIGKDIICLNGPAGELRWGAVPVFNRQRIVHLNASVPCSPCLNLGFEYKCRRMFCMPTISLAMVKNAVQTLLENQSHPAAEARVVEAPLPSREGKQKRTRAVRELSLTDLPELAQALFEEVTESGFVPDCLVYLETGGKLLAAELSTRFRVGVIPLFIHRKEMIYNIYKSRLAGLLVLLPLWVKNALRRWEVRQGWLQKGRDRKTGHMARVNLNGAKVLIVDDAIDTGFSVRTAKNWAVAMGARAQEVKTAVITLTKELEEGRPDFWLFSQICRFPWSVDSPERAAFQARYQSLKLTPYPDRPLPLDACAGSDFQARESQRGMPVGPNKVSS